MAMSVGAAVGALVLAVVVAAVSAVWLSASAAELRRANRDALGAADLAREREKAATEAAEAARMAEQARQVEANAARAAQARAEESGRLAQTATEKEADARKKADETLVEWKKALEREGILVTEAGELKVAVQQALQKARDQNLTNVLAAANDRVKDGKFAEAGELLGKIPPEHRGWEWAVLDRFVQAKGTPYVETALPVGKGSLFSVRFSRNLSRALVVDNPRPGTTQLVVLDVDSGAELYRATVP